MRQCSTCNETFDDERVACPSDGGALGEPDPLLGTVLDGRYLLKRLLGSGAMGTVYEATHVELGRHVAVKVMRERLPAPSLLARFEREALAVARLRHPNIVTVYDFVKWSEGGGAYIVMEYLEGESLSEALGRLGRFTPDDAVGLVEPVCRALQAAHDAGVLHRDLKPQNLFLEREGAETRLKVLDFGVVKLHGWAGGEETAEGELVGTPIYMAPEQAAGDDVDGRADVYALGAVLYEMLTGRPPHAAVSIAALLTRKLTRRPPRASDVAEGVPPALADVLERALAADRRDRYATARDLGLALRAALAGTSGPAGAASHLPAGPSLERMTRFVGREAELVRVADLLESSRLVTLSGPGGIGKTRLALEVLDAVSARHGIATLFVDLAGVGEERLVPSTVASALGIRETAAKSPAESIAAALRSRRSLLALDNCEHVVDAVAELATVLLNAESDVRVLATSREALGVLGEVVWRVGPLETPPAGACASECESVRLFVDRAKLVRPGFAVTERNASVVAALCRELEGIPLAVELAAALVRVLPVEEILARMSDRFRLLSVGQKSTSRPRTLRAALDWSYDLLTEEERALFRRLSVFAGGWALEAAEAICRIDECGDPRRIHHSEVLQHLVRLVDKSLVAAGAVEGASRYRMLETVRQYARERLAESGELDGALRAHRDWYLGVAEHASRELRGPKQAEWYRRLDHEYDNLRAALVFSIDEARDADASMALAGALSVYWDVRGRLTEGLRWLSAALALDGGTVAHRARAHYGEGILAYARNDLERAETCAEQCLSLRREAGERREVVAALNLRSLVALYRGDYALARACLEESVAVSESLDDAMVLASARRGLGGVALYTGDLEGARRAFAECIEGYRAAGNTLAVAIISSNLAEALRLLGETDEALRLLDESIRTAQESGATSVEAYAALILGRTLGDAGDPAASASAFARAVEINAAIDNEGGLVEALENGVRLLAVAGDVPLGARALGAAERWRLSRRSPRQPVYERELDALVPRDVRVGRDDDLSVQDALALVAEQLRRIHASEPE